MSQPENRFDSRAMGPKKVLQPHRAEVLRRPVERVRVGLEEVETTQCGVHAGRTHALPGVLEGIDDSRVSTAGNEHESLIAIDHERHILRNVVFDQ